MADCRPKGKGLGLIVNMDAGTTESVELTFAHRCDMEPPNTPNLSRPKADQNPFNFTESQAATTYAGSMAGAQPNDDDDDKTNITFYSYRSGIDAANFLKESHGRTVNAVNDAYFLPTDGDEWNRLDKQHMAMFLGLSGLYPMAANVPAVLQPQAGQTKILDLGCGTGVWTAAIAREFPHARVLGVDIAPIPAEPENLPENCRFEVDDINLGLDHFEGQFDLVHARLVGSGIKNFEKTMSDVEKCLKPGGLVLWLDADYALYSTSAFAYSRPPASEHNPSGSWLQRLSYEMLQAAILGGSDLQGMGQALDGGLWGRPLLDPATCKTAELFLPLGPWATGRDLTQTQYVNYVGALMRQDVTSMHRAIHPLLIRTGWSRETLSEWSEKADEEISTSKDQMSMRIRIAWGRRRAAEGEPAPVLQAVEQDPEALSRPKYPYFRVYDSEEEALAQAALRNRDQPAVSPVRPIEEPKKTES